MSDGRAAAVELAVRRPPWILPAIVLSQFAGTSLWFAGNAVLGDLQAAWGLAPDALGYATSAVQLGFIAGTLAFASNDPGGDAVVHLHGIGLVPPDIALGRTSASEDLIGNSPGMARSINNVTGRELR